MSREEHDRGFKTLIREFLREFIRLFFPDWYERFDFDEIVWLDKEVFLDPPRGGTRNLDLVAQVQASRSRSLRSDLGKPESWIVLVHIEIEADDRITRLRPPDVRLLQRAARPLSAASVVAGACTSTSGWTASAGTSPRSTCGNGGYCTLCTHTSGSPA